LAAGCAVAGRFRIGAFHAHVEMLQTRTRDR